MEELQMAPNDKAPGKPKTRKGAGTKSSSDASDLLTLTIHAETGRIVKIESVDSTGAHHELSEEEKANLAKEKSKATVEAIIEQAFEAGVACVLGEVDGEDDPPESTKDADLRHLLLRPLIEDSAAKRLMRRDILSRAILATLIQNSTSSRPDRESSPARQ
jgi:hypothetical protein